MKENPPCFFHNHSNAGYVCAKCSTSGSEYIIHCRVCLAIAYGTRLNGYKTDVQPVIEKSLLQSEKFRSNLCDRHKAEELQVIPLKVK